MYRFLSIAVLATASITAPITPAMAADADAAKQPSTARVISHADTRQKLARPGDVTILDLRRDSDYNADTVTMPGARRFDAEKIAE